MSKDNYIGDTLLFGGVVLLIGSIVRMGASIYLPAMPLIGEEFHINSSMMSNTLAIYFVVFSIFTIISGVISDAYGRKPILLTGMVFFMLGAFVCGISQDYTTLMIGRAIQAFGASMIPGTLVAMVRDSCSDVRVVSLLGYLGVIGGLFLVIAPMIGGVLTHFLNWRASFWFLILFTSAIFIITIFKISETNTSYNKTPLSPKVVFSLISTMLRSSKFILVLLPVMIFFMFQGLFLSLTPYIVMGKYGLNSVWFGVSNIFIVIGLFYGRWLSVYLLKKHDEAYVYRLSGYSCIFIAILFFSLYFESSSNLWSFLIINGIFSTILGMVSPIGMKVSITSFRENSGIAAALQGASLLGSIAFGSFISGSIMKNYPEMDAQTVFSILSIFFCLMATIALLKNKLK